MKKTLIWFVKAFIAGTTALCVANIFCFFYYNLPVHYTNQTGATDYYWDENHFSSRGTEGFAATKTDENGFVNTYPYKKESIDVLVMGSSHAEGFNVNSDENFTYILNSKFHEKGLDKYAYNIGTSGHDFLRCLRNLENAFAVYAPKEYIVIEATSIDYDIEKLEQLNNGTYDTFESYNSGLVYTLQKIDFFRLIYAQLNNYIKNNKVEDKQNVSEKTISSEYIQLLESALCKASQTTFDNGCKLIVVYTSELETDYNGHTILQKYTPKQEIFKSICQKYNIEFVDMHSAYKEMYMQTFHLPRGFSNTAVGKGHTNKYGHSCIAQTLYDIMIEG